MDVETFLDFETLFDKEQHVEPKNKNKTKEPKNNIKRKKNKHRKKKPDISKNTIFLCPGSYTIYKSP